MTERTARCSCGQLQASLAGEPALVLACHCLECQRRTGSVFGVSAYYPRASVAVRGDTIAYARSGDAGRQMTSRFCPACGSTVLWEIELFPELVGIAVGNIADPAFPAPMRSAWEQSRHQWVDFTCQLARTAQQSG